jgi:molecular chaperone GrpE
MELIPPLNSTGITITKGCLMVQPDSENVNNSQILEEDEIEKLKTALTEEKSKCETNLAGWQRAQADFINYKRFAEQEKTEIGKYASISLMSNLLPVIDDFERAIASIPPKESDSRWVEGLKLIDRKFQDTLQKQGISCIETIGKEFDPYVMEAVSCSKGKKDVVILELEKGYKLQDKVIRPAKVIVGSGEEEGKKEG